MLLCPLPWALQNKGHPSRGPCLWNTWGLRPYLTPHCEGHKPLLGNFQNYLSSWLTMLEGDKPILSRQLIGKLSNDPWISFIKFQNFEKILRFEIGFSHGICNPISRSAYAKLPWSIHHSMTNFEQLPK